MRKIWIVMALLLVCSLVAVSAQGQQEGEEKLWPRTRPVVTVGFGAGGGTDTAVRPIIAEMEEYLGETINVVNMDGASSAVAARHVLNLPADGYNMFATGSGPFSIFRVMETADTNWEDWATFHPFSGPAVLLVRPDSDVETFAEAMDMIENEDINVGISGFGVGPHVLMEAILSVAGIDSPNYVTASSCRNASVACISGDVDMTIATFSAAVDFVKAGELRALAVTTAEDYDLQGKTIPSITKVLDGSENIPMLSETWPILIRRDVPQKYIDKLTEAFLYAIEQPNIIEYADEQALDIVGYHGEEADRFLSFSEAGYSWTVYNAGLTDVSPAEFGIPTLEEWDWETSKELIE